MGRFLSDFVDAGEYKDGWMISDRAAAAAAAAIR